MKKVYLKFALKLIFFFHKSCMKFSRNFTRDKLKIYFNEIEYNFMKSYKPMQLWLYFYEENELCN